MSRFNGVTPGRQSQPSVRTSFGNLAHDAIELGELQLKLFKTDSLEAATKAKSSMAIAAIGIACLLASLPVALFAVAEALIEFADWSRAAAMAAAAGGALVLCLLFTLVGGWRLRQSLTTWQRSGAEFNRNVAWLKSALRGETKTSTPTPGFQEQLTNAQTRGCDTQI